MSKLLITTADERTWKFNQPVIFLGEWCRLYGRKNIWEPMDSIVAPPYGLEPGKKEKDRIYLSRVIDDLAGEISDALNSLHNTDYGQRFWRILLGHWLQRFVYVSFNRYHSLGRVIEDFDISKTIILKRSDYKLATTNTIDFIWALYDDAWNNFFYSKVLPYFRKIAIEEICCEDGVECFVSEPNASGKVSSSNHSVISKIKKSINSFSRSSDAFIISSYLPLSRVIHLQLKLKQFPAFWESAAIPKFEYDERFRKQLHIGTDDHQGFEHFLRSILSESIPMCFIEGFQQLLKLSDELPWPTKPKFIFTSTNFDTDELFKIWTANKVEKGHKYFVGQHGNNYGTSNYSLEQPEILTSDKFISWGWQPENLNVIPAFILKVTNKKKIKIDKSGGLLLVQRCLHSRQTTFDNYYENIGYQKDQFSLVSSLPKEIINKLTIRLYLHKPSNIVWGEKKRWLDFNSSLIIDDGKSSIAKLIQKSRLVIYSYDSTGILEALALNIPTTAFWYPLLEELLPEAVIYYRLLIKAGILFESPEELAAHISRYWNNIDEWWMSQDVQNARVAFCNKYAKAVKNPVGTLLDILNN